MADENYVSESNIDKSLDFKEVESEIKIFKLKQNETFDFYIDSIDKLIEKVEKTKKLLEEKKRKNNDLIKDQSNILNNDSNTITKNDNLNKNDCKNIVDIKELIKDVKNSKISEKISEENKKFYNILLVSYKGIISLIKHETPEIFKDVYIKKNVILRLILLHFLQKGDFFMYYVLNREILKKNKEKCVEKDISKIDKSNMNNITESKNNIKVNNNFNILEDKNEIKINSNDKNIELNKSNSLSKDILVNNFNLYSIDNNKKNEKIEEEKKYLNNKICNTNRNSKNGEKIEKQDGNKNILIDNYIDNNGSDVLSNINNSYCKKIENIKKCNIVNNIGKGYITDKHYILLNNININNVNLNNKEDLFSKLKQEYISKIKFENDTEEIYFENALIEKEIFEGYKKLHTILYNLKNFQVEKCIEWYNSCSETIKKKYYKLIYLLHCINYLIYSKSDKGKALSCLRNIMTNYKENISHISRLSTFICIGVDNFFFKNMFSNVHSKIFNYFKRAFNEEGLIINLKNKYKLKKVKKINKDSQNSRSSSKDLSKKSSKNQKLRKRKKCNKSEKNLKKKNSFSKSKDEQDENKYDDDDNSANDVASERSFKICMKKKRKKNNRSSSLISYKKEDEKEIKNKKKIKKKLKKIEHILERKIKKGYGSLKKRKKKKYSRYTVCHKEYILRIKRNCNRIPLIHNNIYKEKYSNAIYENLYNLNKKTNIIPLSEKYMENNINCLIEKEKRKRNPFYYDVCNGIYANNNNLILPKIKFSNNNNNSNSNNNRNKNKNKNEEKLNKGWYRSIFNCTKDVFSEIAESQNDVKNIMKKNIKLNKNVDHYNYIYNMRSEPIYLYELSENEFNQFYQNDNSYTTYKILNKAAQFYDNNDTKISNNLVKNLNSGYNTSANNNNMYNNNLYNENMYNSILYNDNFYNNNHFYNNNIYNNIFCNNSMNSYAYLNNSCFIRKPNVLKRKLPKCRFLSILSKKTEEKNEFLPKEVNLEDVLLNKKKKSEKIEQTKDNNSGTVIKETKKNKEDLKEKKTGVEYITSVLKKYKKNEEDYEYFNFKDTNKDTNEYSCSSFYSDRSYNSNKSSDYSSENNFFNDSGYEEKLKKKINKVKEEVDLIKEDYLKKNTMTALLNTKNIQANNRAILAAKNTRLTKTSIDVSRILLTHALTTRDIYTLHNTLTNNKNNAEFRRICLKWKAKKIKRRNRLRKKEKNDESNDDEDVKTKRKKKKNNNKINKKKKVKKKKLKNSSKNEKEQSDNDGSSDDYKKKKKSSKRSRINKLEFKYGDKKNKFISIVKPSIPHSLECFGLEEFIKLTKKNLFVKKSCKNKDEKEKKSSKLKNEKICLEKKKKEKEKKKKKKTIDKKNSKELDSHKDIVKTIKEEKEEKDEERRSKTLEYKEETIEKEKESKREEDKEEKDEKEKECKIEENEEKSEKGKEYKREDKEEKSEKEKEYKREDKEEKSEKEKEYKREDKEEKYEKEGFKQVDSKEEKEKQKNTDEKCKHEYDKKDNNKTDIICRNIIDKNDRSKTGRNNNNDNTEIDITKIGKRDKSEVDKKNKNEIDKKDKNEVDKKDENVIDATNKNKEDKDAIGTNNKIKMDEKKEEEKDRKDKDDIETKVKKEKKGIFYGSYRRNLKKRRYNSNLLLDENALKIEMKRNKNENRDTKSKKNQKESRTNKNIKFLSIGKKKLYRKDDDNSSSSDRKRECNKKTDKEKDKDEKKNHENNGEKEKKRESYKNKVEKEEKNKILKEIKKENYEDKKRKKRKEKNIKERAKEKKIFIHLESPLSILVCGGLISSKKLIEAQAILKENNKRLQEAKNNSLLNSATLKSSDKLSDKLIKEKNSSTKKENGSFFSNSLAVEVDLSGCFFFHSSFTCPISRDKSSKDNPPYLLTCGHAICKNCVDKIHAQRSRQFKCPMCPQYLHLLEIIPLYFS